MSKKKETNTGGVCKGVAEVFKYNAGSERDVDGS